MNKYDLKKAIEKEKIVSFSAGPSLVTKELEAAKEDLLDAKDLFSRERFKSATTLAYYTIFHTARALLGSFVNKLLIMSCCEMPLLSLPGLTGQSRMDSRLKHSGMTAVRYFATV